MRAWTIPVPQEISRKCVCCAQTMPCSIHVWWFFVSLCFFIFPLDFMLVIVAIPPSKTVRPWRRLKLQPILICLDLESATQLTCHVVMIHYGAMGARLRQMLPIRLSQLHEGFWWCQDMPRMLKRMRKMTRRKTSPWLIQTQSHRFGV